MKWDHREAVFNGAIHHDHPTTRATPVRNGYCKYGYLRCGDYSHIMGCMVSDLLFF